MKRFKKKKGKKAYKHLCSLLLDMDEKGNVITEQKPPKAVIPELPEHIKNPPYDIDELNGILDTIRVNAKRKREEEYEEAVGVVTKKCKSLTISKKKIKKIR